MPRGEMRPEGAGRVDRESIREMYERMNADILASASAPAEPVVKKKSTGSVSAKGVNPVKVTKLPEAPLTDKEQAEHADFLANSNIDERREKMNRKVNFPIGKR
jgi:hypothetical protein